MSVYDCDFKQLYRIYTTVHEMMNDRKYEPERKKLSEDKYISKIVGYTSEESPYRFMDKLSVTFKKDSSRVIVYFFILNIKITKNDINVIYNDMQEKNIDGIVLILKEKITPKVSSIMKTFRSQVFYHYELVNNPLKHVLMPKSISVMNIDEKNKLLKDYSLTDDKYLPGIFKDQPISKWFNLNDGDVVKIIRKNDEIYYRVVRV